MCTHKTGCQIVSAQILEFNNFTELDIIHLESGHFALLLLWKLNRARNLNKSNIILVHSMMRNYFDIMLKYDYYTFNVSGLKIIFIRNRESVKADQMKQLKDLPL